MTTLLNKVFGAFDLNQNIKTQLDSKEEEDFLKSPVRSLEGNERVSASIEANAAADATLTSDTIQVNNEIEFNKVITDHIADYDVEREYETLVKLGQLHNTINKALAAKGHVQNTQDYSATLDILSEDLYSTENNSSNSLWGAIAKEHSLPNIRTVTAAVAPDIYHTLAGEKNAKFGGMSDANMYPEEMFARWTKSGNIYEFPKQTGGHVSRELMYGKEVGSKVHAGMKNAYIRHNKIISGKYGGILSGSLYAFFALSMVLGRWEFVNWREEQRQRLKYALRIVDPEAPVTQSQKDIAEVHKKWLQTYYEEEEEEEEEEEDDE